MQVIQAKQALTPGGWQSDVEVVIGENGRIESVGSASQTPTHRAALLLPAPLNLHSHAFQRAMAGLTEARGPDPSDSFWSWRRLMYTFLDQLTPDDVEAIAGLVFMEMLEAGYGAVAEFHYLHHDVGGVPYANLAEMSERIVAASENAGIGLTLLPVHYQFGGCDLRPLNGGQQRFGNGPDQFLRLHADAAAAVARGPADFVIGVAPHSLRAVDSEGLRHVLEQARTGPIHMHLAEQVAEVDEVLAHMGARPTEWLLANHAVDERWCLIHCTQMTDAETKDLARSGAVAGLCPITESSLGDGIFNGTTYLGAGGTIGFGSDSNIHIALFDELKTLEYSQRLRDRSRAALATPDRSTGRVLFEAAANGGAQAGGRDTGRIEIGALADLIGLDDDNEWLCNRQGDALLDSLIFGGGGGACIRDVWSAGRHVVRQGRHFRRDAIISSYKATMQRLETDI
ncbi:formimidoylglutamate deiminase [Lutimaribacter sp. EGI FJ00015]|uniref:Formimidoylglutamate deiminase n=1 Tax=Lutimaribacter degradans TaxID=2945989 RepID=A0ACC5ZZX3_9RHOB|nr:formimidoylglutamate deiminase [Lutimaribacter sp. EGI FJ00013]MCO0614546.1 formimidoylglutamate deiminase [Lutimaribacter sp. EGI FJ00015]MCO0637219.1 formimidoylglutamate deiminase [Lutimaribacter sp. EGI FJ00014]